VKLLRGAFALISVGLALAAVDAAVAADGGPKPDPPPVAPPPPPPPPRPAPPPPVDPAPPPPVDPAPPPPPVYRGPSAAEIAAARRAAQARRAQRLQAQRAKARRLALQRAKARRLALQRKQAKARLLAEARKRAALAAEPEAAPAAFSVDRGSAKFAVPLVIAFVLALISLALSFVPAYVVPWYRASMVLDTHRQEFALVGTMALLATGIFFLMLVLSG
jgi:colicin import membrane protein